MGWDENGPDYSRGRRHMRSRDETAGRGAGRPPNIPEEGSVRDCVMVPPPDLLGAFSDLGVLGLEVAPQDLVALA